MEMDLKGKAPKASTLDEANKIIKALWDIIQKLDDKDKNKLQKSLTLFLQRSILKK